MNLFTDVKAAVSVKDAAIFYGINVRRGDMCCCPFHSDKHPSMKFYKDNFYCFGCNEGGDVIHLVSKLFGLSQYDSALKLISDFNLNISVKSSREDYSLIRQKQAEIQRQKDAINALNLMVRDAVNILKEYHLLLERWRKEYAPTDQEAGLDDCHPLFEEAQKRQCIIASRIDDLENGTQAEKFEAIKIYAKEIKEIESRINRFYTTGL